MSEIKVKVLDKNTLELLEDAKTGDTINLDSITSIDTSFVNELISKHKDEYIKEKLDEANSRYALSLDQEINKIKSTTSIELKEKDLEHLQEISRIKASYDEMTSKLKEELKKLTFEKEKITATFESDSRAKLVEATSTIQEKLSKEILLRDTKINDLKNELNHLKDTHEKDLTNKELLIRSEYKDLLANEREEKLKIQNDLDNLMLKKDSNNVKKLGEQLEHWCNEEYENARVAGFENCEWFKDNDAIKNEFDSSDKASKADYIFKMYTNANHIDENVITSVCLEMKNEAPNSVNKRTNESYYSKLNKDRNKKNLEYALLVSELEWGENDAPIKKVSEYEKMYVVRPQYMITFLSIIYTLGKKYRELILNIKEKDEELKDIVEINEEFENFKETYVNKPINELNNQLEKMRNNSATIIKAANQINYEIDLITSKTIQNILTKIERFSIKKDSLNRKINKLNK